MLGYGNSPFNQWSWGLPLWVQRLTWNQPLIILVTGGESYWCALLLLENKVYKAFVTTSVCVIIEMTSWKVFTFLFVLKEMPSIKIILFLFINLLHIFLFLLRYIAFLSWRRASIWTKHFNFCILTGHLFGPYGVCNLIDDECLLETIERSAL